ncbi:wax ester/triacylglycerol synthase domain-containing protein [Micromonospora purpureochromogenes]|uniref:wax ester/triacylglycerol synthase domain-containing protein n=1 Tax=Micromonospora purpureochromogenes TaxID=47872 RepID=UPI00340F2F78
MRIDRLSATDLTNLAVEAADTPAHIGGLLVVDGGALLDADGRLRMTIVRAGIERRLDRVPKLRKVVYRPGLLAGRSLWVDDPAFAIDRHVDVAEVAAPGGEEQLLRLTERLMVPLLSRSRPLWRLWFVTGLPSGRVAMIIKLHHAVADGLAAVQMLRSLLDLPEPADTAPGGWRAAPPPGWSALVGDNLLERSAAVARTARRLADPAAVRRAVGSVPAGWRGIARSWGAPRTSLNVPIGPRRRFAVVRLDLAAVKETAHAYGGKVNDVILNLVAGGLRALLVARGESVDGLTLRVAVAVSTRSPTEKGQEGNRAGGIVVRLPLGERHPGARQRVIAAESRRAKSEQFPGGEQCFIVFLARSGLMRRFTRHQHLTNVIESNVVGWPEPITVLGAPVLDVVPVSLLAGNLTLSFLALSYAGCLTITVCADAERHPDLPVLLVAMRTDWTVLADPIVPEAV